MSDSGLPIAHVGEKVSGDVIVSGSPTVHVGSTAVGMADRASACVPNIGQPVNPMLGCKLLPEEVDFELAAPDTLSFGRGYLSSNPRVSKLGQGWWLPGESMTLELNADDCVLTDAQGRRITFPPLSPGKVLYSGSEQLWLRRGDVLHEDRRNEPWTGRWASVPPELQHNEEAIVVLSGTSYLCFIRQPDGPWRLRSTFGRSGYMTEFSWSQHGLLKGIRDSAGRRYVLVYQQACTAEAGDDGVRLYGVILASNDGPLPANFDPQASDNDWLVRYQFNDSGDLIAVRNRLGEVVRVFAWKNHIMIAHGEPGGLEVRYEWNLHHPEGRVVKQSEVDSLTRTFRYSAGATEVTDSLGRVERYEFTSVGGEKRWTALIRADGSRTEFDYDLFGRLVAVRDPLGRELRRRLDGQGRLLEEESAGKNRYRQTLDEHTGLLKELIDSMERRWTFEHNDSANLTAVNGPAGTTRYCYDDPVLPDRPTRIIDSKGGIKQVQWQRLGLPASITDCSGQTHWYEYDTEGRLITETDPNGQSCRYIHNQSGQIVEVLMADGARLAYDYDAQGRQTRISNAQGHCTRFFWDRADRLVRAVDAAGTELNYTYDAAGRLVTLSNQNGAQACFVFDAVDRLIEETGFDGRRQRYGYNLADELITRIDADDRETHYQYDRDGRLVCSAFPASADTPAFSEHYRWRADGRLAGVKGPQCDVRFAYDSAGNLCLENQIHADGWVYSVEHQHDELGVCENSRYGDAPLVNWLTYGSGHLHGVLAAQVEIAFERDALHSEYSREVRLRGEPHRLFNLQREYDPLGRLTQSQLILPAAADYWQRQYRYDGLGQVVHIRDNFRPDLRYVYDLSGQLIASQHGHAPERRYHFDPAGNRLDADPSSTTDRNVEHAHNELYRSGYSDSRFNDSEEQPSAPCLTGNRVEYLEDCVYRYDAQGHLIERTDPDGNRLHLTWDGANRLVRVLRQRADGEIVDADYRYDGLSRRIAKHVRQNDQEHFVRFGWDGERQCAEVFDELLRTTVHEPDSFIPLLRIEQRREPDSADLLAVRRDLADADQPLAEQYRPSLGNPVIGFFHTDHIGTPLQLSNERGQVIWRGISDDWRAVTEERGSIEQPIRFQGQYHDQESGLYYNFHRYYLPEAGRYASQDPIGYRGGPNGYVYALNAPSVAYDPSGLIVPLLSIGAAIGRVALGAAIEVGMQVGKQIFGQIKSNFENDRNLADIKWRCIDINVGHVLLSGGFSIVAPSMLASAKTLISSGKALKALSGQAACTTNRAAKLAARKTAHSNEIKKTVKAQAAWQTAKLIVKCPFKDEKSECDF